MRIHISISTEKLILEYILTFALHDHKLAEHETKTEQLHHFNEHSSSPSRPQLKEDADLF